MLLLAVRLCKGREHAYQVFTNECLHEHKHKRIQKRTGRERGGRQVPFYLVGNSNDFTSRSFEGAESMTVTVDMEEYDGYSEKQLFENVQIIHLCRYITSPASHPEKNQIISTVHHNTVLLFHEDSTTYPFSPPKFRTRPKL